MRREKSRAKLIPDEEAEKSADEQKLFIDSDDEAANEDLTLKIIEKAMSRASHATVDGGLTCTGGEHVVNNGVVMSEDVKKKKVKKAKAKAKAKKKKEKEIDIEIIQSVANAEEILDASTDAMVINLSEPSADENFKPDNVVLQRLLRGPRYFDPPDKSWGACFNCGEEGHSALNCTSARRKKPCFVCGSLEHEVKQCQKGQDCFICKGQGHRARDCPQKIKRCSRASELCLKCGAPSHIMFSCNNDYSPDDLEGIQCYVCKRFGHLCCVNYFDVLTSEASCYKCGHAGHYGQDCRNSKGETSAGGTPSSCFKCGEEGHFARECTTSVKAKKRTRDSSTPVVKKYPKDKGNKGHQSAPQEFDKPRRKKLYLDDGSPDWPSKPKRRGGWIPDDPDDQPFRNSWRSPATPNKNHRIFNLTAGGHGSSPQHFRNNRNFNFGSPSLRGYDISYEHRHTPSRFGHRIEQRRNNDWW